MEKYQSKEVIVCRPVADAYDCFTDMSALTPFIGDKVEGWEATADTCTFRAKGFPVSLRIDERIPGQLVRVVSDGGTPVNFTVEGHFAPNDAATTRFNITLDIELNMMLRMMVGPKLQEGIDSIAEAVAKTL